MKGKRIEVNKGDKFGRLTVVRELPSRKGYRYIDCICNCGKGIQTKLTLLTTKQAKSCGCLRSENINTTSHNKSRTKLYKVWTSIKQRCVNEKTMAYEYYGGRGITICEDWKNDFNTFYDWAINNGYKIGLTIDRINNNGNYQPNNCRWVTMEVQNSNKRRK
jgi:hypothetical protein